MRINTQSKQALSVVMSIEDGHKEHEDDQAVSLDVLDGVMVEEDVTVDLRETQDDIQDLQIPLVLQVFV